VFPASTQTFAQKEMRRFSFLLLTGREGERGDYSGVFNSRSERATGREGEVGFAFIPITSGKEGGARREKPHQ